MQLHDLGEAEIEHLDAPRVFAFAEHDVGGLEVAMRDAFLVRSRHGFRDRDPDRQHTLERQAAGVQHARKRPTVHQFHRQEDRRAGLLYRMNGDDVRVIKGRDGERFARESLAAIGIGRGDFRQNFQGDLALQPEIARAVDFAHSSDAEHRRDFVRS